MPIGMGFNQCCKGPCVPFCHDGGYAAYLVEVTGLEDKEWNGVYSEFSKYNGYYILQYEWLRPWGCEWVYFFPEPYIVSGSSPGYAWDEMTIQHQGFPNSGYANIWIGPDGGSSRYQWLLWKTEYNYENPRTDYPSKCQGNWTNISGQTEPPGSTVTARRAKGEVYPIPDPINYPYDYRLPFTQPDQLDCEWVETNGVYTCSYCGYTINIPDVHRNCPAR